MRPYLALLQGFKDEEAPTAKRRKLEHVKASAPPPKKPVHEDDEDDDSEDHDDEDESEEGEDLDHVEEQEDPAMDLDEVADDDSSDEEDNTTDPFDVHFAHPDEERSAKLVKAAINKEWTTKRSLVKSWRATTMTPGADGSSETLPQISSLDDIKLKQKLKETAAKKMPRFTDLEKGFGSSLFNYQDILYCDRSVKDSQSLRQMFCLHALNHLFK